MSFETNRGKELVASAEIKTRDVHEGATRFYGYLAFPVPEDLEALCRRAYEWSVRAADTRRAGGD